MKEIIQCHLPLGKIQNRDILQSVMQGIAQYIREKNNDVIIKDNASLGELLNILTQLSTPVVIQIIPISDDFEVIQTVNNWRSDANEKLKYQLFMIYTWKEKLQATLEETIKNLTAPSTFSQSPSTHPAAMLEKIVDDIAPSITPEKEDKNFIDQCKVLYLFKLGSHYQERQQYTLAADLHHTALNLHKNNPQLKPATYLYLLNNLGFLHLQKAEYQQALGRYNESLAIFKKTAGLSVELLCIILYAQAKIYTKLEQYDEALKCYHQAYGAFFKLPNSPHRNERIANTLVNMVTICVKQHDYQEAEIIFGFMITFFGAKNPETANVLNGLGVLQKSRGEYDSAKSYFERALEMLDPQHPYAERSRGLLIDLNQLKLSVVASKAPNHNAQTYSDQSGVLKRTYVSSRDRTYSSAGCSNAGDDEYKPKRYKKG